MKKKKVSEFKIILSVFLLWVFIFLMFGVIINQTFEDDDWWAKALCYKEGGTLKEVFLGNDVCIINGTEYIAKFKGSGEYSNRSGYGEIKRWQLFRK